MFGGGEKKEKKEDEDRGDNSGSAKAQREAKGDEVCLPSLTELLRSGRIAEEAAAATAS